jgi:hypothetical protein
LDVSFQEFNLQAYKGVQQEELGGCFMLVLDLHLL